MSAALKHRELIRTARERWIEPTGRAMLAFFAVKGVAC